MRNKSHTTVIPWPFRQLSSHVRSSSEHADKEICIGKVRERNSKIGKEPYTTRGPFDGALTQYRRRQGGRGVNSGAMSSTSVGSSAVKDFMRTAARVIVAARDLMRESCVARRTGRNGAGASLWRRGNSLAGAVGFLLTPSARALRL